MSTRSGQQFHEFWGSVPARADLPNVAGSSIQKVSLQVGDYAWVTNELTAYRCLDATLGAAQWAAEPWSDSRRGWEIREDWVSLGFAGSNGWSAANAGTNASSQINNANADSLHDGIVESDTGTTAAGRAVLYLGVDGLVTPTAGGLIVAEAEVRLPVLSTGAEEFISRYMFGDSLVAADHTDGIYFEYNRSLGGNFWRCKTAAGGVRTTVTSAIPVAANTWYRLRQLITPTAVNYFVDNVLAATINTNIPTTPAQRYAPNLGLQKTVGLGQRSHLIDYFQARLVTAGER